MTYDSEYDGRMIAATKNIESIFTNLNYFERKRSEDAKRVEQLMATLADQSAQIAKLTQQLATIQAKLYEAGIR
jgi:septal ring factor EnvC (AmiA/AmiB activator)